MGELKSLGRDGKKWDLSIQTFGPCHSIDDRSYEEDFVAAAPFTGLIASTKKDSSTFGSAFSIYHPNRKLISSIPWASSRIVALFWAHDREIVNILTEDAKLLQYKSSLIFTVNLYEPQTYVRKK